jgi:hypothetical protein
MHAALLAKQQSVPAIFNLSINPLYAAAAAAAAVQGLTMGDAFCGLGTVSIAANEVGWQVRTLLSPHTSSSCSSRVYTAVTPGVGCIPCNDQTF